jgi:hypothetical protein
VKAVINLQVPQNAGKFFSGCRTGGHLRRAQLHRVSQCSAFWRCDNNIYRALPVFTSRPTTLLESIKTSVFL